MMKLKNWVNALIVAGCIVGLSACSSTKKPTDDSAIDDANSAYAGDNMGDDSVEASGAGDNDNFGDASHRTAANKNIFYFAYDSNVVADSDIPSINKTANYLTSHPSARVRLEGNTDPRGSREYNVGLGERRAKAVADILLNKGVSPAQVRVVSYGAQKLAVAGHTEDAYRLDRRVVVVYMKR